MIYRTDPFERSAFAMPPDAVGRGRDLAMLNYVLLILGFFTGITPFVALVLAYVRRSGVAGMARSHLDWQIRIVWHGVAAIVTVAVLHAVIVGLGAITFGIGLVFLVIPWAIGIVWLVWTIWAIVRGLRRLNRGLPAGDGPGYVWR